MEVLKTSRVVYLLQILLSRKTKFTFLLIKYSLPIISIKWKNLFRINVLNVKISRYQKQSPEGVL